ncbi:Crp/Fnr family transcriptional regulator [Bacillus sp. FJAT-27231]|uniref:DoxX family membrane protein n=1 Tax=Bacillus sp. FJAT-27231 TaxID=1679168 RepID=UPI000670B927|nr:DoxX family membrane protein [Bacillus sp. FJAT-27231]KMY55611.1 Crp/Fnr family transcriptional regulator [Bacillus sp. FJAT-27231]
MFIRFLRGNLYASYLLFFLRLYLGWQWLQAGWEKISGGQFDASGFLKGAVGKMSGDHPAVQPWWGEFLKEVALPNVGIFNVLVPWGEFLVGLGLILGVFTSYAMLMGLVMNFSYLLSGTMSTNPQLVILGLLILMAGMNAGRIGGDRWIYPYMKKSFAENKDSDTLSKSA